MTTGRYGGGLGIQRSSVKFWSNGGGSRLLNLKKVRRGSCLHFRLQQNNICTIANAFSAINGLKFPHFLEKHAYGPPPPALNALHVRVLKAPSLIWNVFCCPWFTTCAFYTVNSVSNVFPFWHWTKYSENKLAHESWVFQNCSWKSRAPWPKWESNIIL